VVDEEGMSFESAFGTLFRQPSTLEARYKAERVAGRTPKQRARKNKKNRTVQINVRATEAVKALLDQVTAALGGSAGDHFERAIIAYAKANSVHGGVQ
jgi:hypothetical protein